MSNCVIVTGMHRSGTSLFARIVQHAGVHIGDRLLEPGEDNPRGYFEDVDFVEFHNTLLMARGKNLLVDRYFAASITEKERNAARRLVEQREHLPLWGWKDPRTSLFLDLWEDLLPRSRFVFLFRHPYDVLLSLMRRGEIHNIGLLEGLEAWYAYNKRILEFYRLRPEKCTLINVYGALRNINLLREVIFQKLGLNLTFTQDTISNVYHPDELRRAKISSSHITILSRIHNDCLFLYDELQKYSDISDQQSNSHEGEVIAKRLGALENFAKALPESLSVSQRRALLWMLVSISDSDAVEQMSGKVRESISQLELANRWHQDQYRLWKLEAERLSVLSERQTAWIKELETARDYHMQQAENWKRLAEERDAWIRELETARDYHMQQAENWKRLAEERDT